MKRLSKSTPIPTRFEWSEQQFLRELSEQTGLPQAEIIRRGVRSLKQQMQRERPLDYLLALAP